MILIAGVGALGTLVPQYQDEGFYLERYGTLGQFVLWFQLDHYANSVLFAALLVLFFLNTLVCTFWRVIKVWPEIFRMEAGQYQRKISIETSLEKIETELKRRGFIVKRNGNAVFARRGLISKLAPDLIHLGILFAVVGGLISGLTTYQRQYFMNVGDTVQLDQATVTLVDFQFHTYPDGSPKDWISTVEILDAMGKRRREIEVNKPLGIAGGKLYQWSYKPRWEITVEFPELEYTYVGPAATTIEHGLYRIRISPFIPDLRVSNGRVISASDEPMNPAVYIEYYENDKLVGRHWVFALHDFPTYPADFPVKAKLLSYTRSWETGLMFVKSRGDALTLIGLVMISVGSIGLLFPKFLKVSAIGKGEQCEVAIAHSKRPEEELSELLRG